MNVKVTLEGARVMMGYSLNDAAKLFGIHSQTLASWEHDPSKMKQKYIQMIPEIYFVDASNIFFGSKDEFIRVNKKNYEKCVK